MLRSRVYRYRLCARGILSASWRATAYWARKCGPPPTGGTCTFDAKIRAFWRGANSASPWQARTKRNSGLPDSCLRVAAQMTENHRGSGLFRGGYLTLDIRSWGHETRTCTGGFGRFFGVCHGIGRPGIKSFFCWTRHGTRDIIVRQWAYSFASQE